MTLSSFNIGRAIACIKTKTNSGDILQQVTLVPTGEQPVIKDLNNGLLVVYLVVDGDELVYVQQHQLLAAGLTREELHKIGVANLMGREGVEARLKQYGEIYGLFLDEVFEASLILCDDLWDDELAELAPNGFVAALPSRDALAVCDAHSQEGLASLRMMVARAFSGAKNNLLTQDLYIRRNGRWEIFS